MINVIIADDHAVVRTGLQLLFDTTSDITMKSQAETGNELLEQIKKDSYDVVILDILMPGKDAIDVLKEIKQTQPNTPVIIFSMNPESKYAIRMFKNGASAYINKEFKPQKLIEVIRTVATGKKYYTPSQSELIANNYLSDNETKLPHENLSDREFQVMVLLAYGMRKTEIANKLGVSKNTISNHRNNILKKMNLESNSEITRYSIKHGLID